MIAGMGGILISDIIQQSPETVQGAKHLILQPQSHAEILRSYLTQNGFRIEKENICEDSGRVYCIMSVYFDGESREYPEWYEYYGEIPSCTNPLAKEYLLKLSDRYVRDAGNMRCADPIKAEELYRVADTLNKITAQ